MSSMLPTAAVAQAVGGRGLTRAQRFVLTLAFAPMLGTGVAGGVGTYTNISGEYGQGTAVGAVAAGEGATAVLALVLLGLTMLGQSSPAVVRAGLWFLPAAASAMAVTAADDVGQRVIYAVTPMGMTVAAEGMAFLARRIVVHQNGGRDVEADARAAAVVRELAYHRARAMSHPDEKKRKASERRSWVLARRVGHGDPTLAGSLLDIQRTRLQSGADAALADMFGGTSCVPERAVVVEGTTPRAIREESTQEAVKRSPSGQPEHLPVKATESGLPAPDPTADRVAPTGADRPVRPVVAAADASRPSRVTAPVPPSARTVQPKRTRDELLTEAREKTADWSDEALTANAIRLAVRTSAENARRIRDALKAERTNSAKRAA